jgi:hypothetical protein
MTPKTVAQIERLRREPHTTNTTPTDNNPEELIAA